MLARRARIASPCGVPVEAVGRGRFRCGEGEDTAMILVQVWIFVGSKRAWGHASMHVDRTYISWWPGGEGRNYKLSRSLPV
jgi:hypothetical protein